MTVRLISTARRASLALAAFAVLAGARPAWTQSSDSTAAYRPVNLATTFQELERKMEELEVEKTLARSAVHTITIEGHYPPGRYVGQCEITSPPGEPVIGQRYEVRRITSRFYRLSETGAWMEVGAFSPPAGAREYRCASERGLQEQALLLTPDPQGGGHYKLVVSGYVQEWHIVSCEDGSDGSCAVKVAHRDLQRDIPFTIYQPR